ncbi:MAG: hypothetical protein WCF22_03485 [Candidatus Sulfotelmatobacter sp.]
MPLFTLSRPQRAMLIAAIALLTASMPRATAQEDPDDAPLGDIARSLRGKSVVSPETVIDNDNLSQVVEGVESRREAGLLPVLFSLDSGYNSFHVSSPDVTCSLSFSAKNATFSDQLLLKELPSSELSKLDGPAIIDGDTLQVTVHNGTSWELQEVVIGLTIVRNHDSGAAVSYPANAEVAAAAEAISGTLMAHFQKQADTTILLRIKGSAAPSTTAIFRTSLNFALFPDQEWHWAIVKAKGIPPQIAPVSATATETGTIAVPQIDPPLSLQPKPSDIVGIAPAIAPNSNADVQPQ